MPRIAEPNGGFGRGSMTAQPPLAGAEARSETAGEHRSCTSSLTHGRNCLTKNEPGHQSRPRRLARFRFAFSLYLPRRRVAPARLRFVHESDTETPYIRDRLVALAPQARTGLGALRGYPPLGWVAENARFVRGCSEGRGTLPLNSTICCAKTHIIFTRAKFSTRTIIFYKVFLWALYEGEARWSIKTARYKSYRVHSQH